MALNGSVYDVAVDVRPGSPTFRRWFGVELSGGTGNQLFIPVGFAHGFLALSDDVVLMYLTTALYQPSSEIVVRWDDPTLGIAWRPDPGRFQNGMPRRNCLMSCWTDSLPIEQ
jgi:dTDP-4-dehydrorhamnose 3,5-epimerase